MSNTAKIIQKPPAYDFLSKTCYILCILAIFTVFISLSTLKCSASTIDYILLTEEGEGSADETIEDDDFIITQDHSEEGVYLIELKDPHIKFNKFMLKFNTALDSAIIRPVAKQYSILVPNYITKRIFLMLRNLQEPLSFVSNVLQLETHQALKNIWRFTINSTIGLAGAYDVASKLNLQYTEVRFENVLHKMGFKPGEYLVLPIIGPTSTRGAVGFVADFLINPVNHFLHGSDIYIYRGTDIISARDEYREEINNLLYGEEDSYTLLKSIYEQKLLK